jgi:hypothetical protein
MIGSDDTVFTSTGYDLEARDLIGGALKWSIAKDASELPLQASDDGSALLYDQATGALTVVENGTRTSTDVYPVLRNPVRTAVDELSGGFVDLATSTIAIGKFQTRARNDLTLFPTQQRQNAIDSRLDIVINTFIPEEWLDTPLEWLAWLFAGPTWWTGNSIFEGDNRTDWDINGPSRSKHHITVSRMGGIVENRTAVGESRLYHKESSLDASQTHITAAARADTELFDSNMLMARAYSPSKGRADIVRLPSGNLLVTLRFDGSNPLFNVLGLNTISYEMKVTIDFDTMRYQLTGEHDGFPNYEMYLNQHRIHDFSHGTNNPNALFPPMEIEFEHPWLEIQP